MSINDQTHILVCDDEPDVREMVGEFFAERGYDTHEAEDASSLFKKLNEQGADIVILDINMPGDDGLTALRQLRERSDLPVIMLTAASEVIDRVVGLEDIKAAHQALRDTVTALKEAITEADLGRGVSDAARNDEGVPDEEDENEEEDESEE